MAGFDVITEEPANDGGNLRSDPEPPPHGPRAASRLACYRLVERKALAHDRTSHISSSAVRAPWFFGGKSSVNFETDFRDAQAQCLRAVAICSESYPFCLKSQRLKRVERWRCGVFQRHLPVVRLCVCLTQCMPVIAGDGKDMQSASVSADKNILLKHLI
jgi:hypothetical protein